MWNSASGVLDSRRLSRRELALMATFAGLLHADNGELRAAIARLRYFTPIDGIKTVLDKGKSGAPKLSPDEERAAGLTPDTWTLWVGADADGGSVIEAPVTLNWDGLMKLAAKHTVRYPHVAICANGMDPFHMTMWEGVPLREIVWRVKPKSQVRRVRYESYHPPEQKSFQASLPLARVLETPPGEQPVILAYKMNGQLIPVSKGGPVRVIVPGCYGGKLIKWVKRIALTNDYKSTDTDAEFNNDTESPLKTRARFIETPAETKAGKAVAISGYAQVGISGLAKVQYSVHPDDETMWRDATILPPSAEWGADKPANWPLRYTLAHWAGLVDPLPAGSYELACRTVDLNGIAQPMPRPFARTGVTEIHRVPLIVRGA